ncbi:bone morphogenetic protein 5-like isoform X1 [Stigmatopora nigra]
MSIAVFATMALICSPVVVAFVLQPPEQKNESPQDSINRCHGDSLESIRKDLLAALNLQAEPRLPEGNKKQWSGTAERLQAVAGRMPSGYSSDNGQDTQGGCTQTCEVSMTDLGWGNWMIYPERLTLVNCGHDASCRLNTPKHDDSEVQTLCCQPTAHEVVPVMYMDEFNTVVITSVRMIHRCGCPAGRQPRED